jgi:O-antigen ligase/tetratricopeptide (TPR) repeat protein
LEQAAVVLATALAVARPAFPSEDAHTGSGLVVVALWGVAAVLWAAAQAVRGELHTVASPVDACVGLLLLVILVSVTRADSLRPAINMAGEWAGLVVAYFVVRQLFRDAVRQRVLVVSVLALAFTLAAHGIYQAFWGLELTRAEYRRDPAGMLRSLGIVPGSPEQQTFLNRLNSHEPFATFALANSLAGFLVAWLPIGIVRLLEPHAQQGSAALRQAGRLLAGGAVLLTFLAIVLTQSRTAYAAVVVQVTGLAWCYGLPLVRQHGRRALRWLVAGGCIAGLGLGITIFFALQRGKIDEKLLSQATKSFGYRWEFWQATAQLVRDRFWLGVGPGNFREHYLRYKLPESSEEIADPHNLLLEVWATSGVFAALALVAAVGLGLVRLIARRPAGQQQPSPQLTSWPALVLAGVAGWALAATLSPLDHTLYIVLALVWFIAASVFGAVAPLRAVSPRAVGVAIAGTILHLLGAGGIGMPGVAQSVWLLLALGVSAADSDGAPRTTRRRLLARIPLILSGIALIAFGVWVLRPVTASLAELGAGRAALERDNTPAAERHFRAAARRDPLAAEPWLELFRIHYDRWQYKLGQQSGPEAEEEFERAIDAAEQARRRTPKRLEPHTLRARLFAKRAAGEPGRLAPQPRFWAHAAEAYQHAVVLYPTSASMRERLADALWHAGEHEQARAEARRALDLDAQTPHADKKLAATARKGLEQLLAGAGGGP